MVFLMGLITFIGRTSEKYLCVTTTTSPDFVTSNNILEKIMNFIFGASGFAREVDWLVNDIYNLKGLDYRTDYFVDNDDNNIGSEINGKKVISEIVFFNNYSKDNNNVIIAIANSHVRLKIADMIADKTNNTKFPVIVHPDARFDERNGKVSIGKGSIICAGAVITTDIVIGEFVHININCTIGHDSILEDFTTLSPCVSISGNALISRNSYLGTGAIVLPSVNICSDTVIGAGAVVSKNVDISGTYVGMPARKVR